MGIGYPKDWAVTNRTSLDESASMSKNVRRYGVNGSKGDFPHGSTGDGVAHESDIAPSVAARNRGRIGAPRSEQVGHATDGSGKWMKTTHDPDLIGNAIQTHEALKPQGLMKDANSKFGQRSRVPAGKDESYRSRADAGALAGDGDRTSYSGGGGKIKP